MWVSKDSLPIHVIILIAFVLGMVFSFFLTGYFSAQRTETPINYTQIKMLESRYDLLGDLLNKYNTSIQSYDDLISALERMKSKLEEENKTLENEKSLLRERAKISTNPDCVLQENPEFSEDVVRNLVNPNVVRNLAVMITSYSGEEPILALYRYVRDNIKYVQDPRDKEYVASPCETLLTGGGDCEDHAILYASLLESIGIDAEIVWLVNTHTFVGIAADPEKYPEITKGQGCEKPMWVEYDNKKLLLADTTFAPCLGQVESVYINKTGSGWEFKEDYKSVIFDV